MTEAEVFAVHSTSLAKTSAEILLPTKFFTALVACDSDELSAREIGDFAKSLLEKGAVYICTWGKGCERFHDIVDEAEVEMDVLEKPRPDKYSGTLMTTWHEDDSLSEALWFLLTCAWPLDEELESCSTIVITIGNQSWANEINRHLEDIEKFRQEISNAD